MVTLMSLVGGISMTELPDHSDRLPQRRHALQADRGRPQEDVCLGERPTYQKVLAWSGTFHTRFYHPV